VTKSRNECRPNNVAGIRMANCRSIQSSSNRPIAIISCYLITSGSDQSQRRCALEISHYGHANHRPERRVQSCVTNVIRVHSTVVWACIDYIACASPVGVASRRLADCDWTAWRRLVEEPSIHRLPSSAHF